LTTVNLSTSMSEELAPPLASAIWYALVAPARLKSDDVTEQREQREQRYGTPFATRAQAAARQIGKLSRLSASAFGSFGRAALVRCLDPGYDPGVANGAHEHRKETTIDIKDLSVRYGRRIALENLTGAFGAGSMTAIVGPNGAGKSTLLKALAGIVRTRRGAITNVGGGRVAYLPQQSALERDFPITVRGFVALGGWRHFGAFRSPPPDIAARVVQATAAVGLDGLASRAIADLSVGQFQRALFARMLMQDADVLLLDEPFAAIDERTSEDLLHLLRHWHDEGRTIAAVLHDLAEVRAHFPRTLLLARRGIVWGEIETVLTAENLALARAMLEGESGIVRDEAA
jgi:zinc/manganese transport system ATP-binding protein